MVGVDYAAKSEEIKLSDLQKYDWRIRSVYKLDNSIFWKYSIYYWNCGWDCKDDLNLSRYSIPRLI